MQGKGTKSKGAKYRKEKRETHRQKVEQELAEQEQQEKILKVTEFVTVNELATMMDVPINKVIGACMSLGIMVTMNQRLDAETLSIVADEFGYEYSREYPNEVITNDYISAANIVRIKLVAETLRTFEHGFENSISKIMFDTGMKPFDFFDGLTSFVMENDLSCKMGKAENLYRIIYTYAADLYDKNEDTLKLQILQEVLHSDMNNNVSQDVIRRLERKGWEIHVKAKS